VGYYFFPPGIIQLGLPEKNSYCHFKEIETIAFSRLEDFRREKMVQFICKHYLKNGENVFSPSKENIMSYFKGHNAECFFSVYSKEEPLVQISREQNITKIPNKKMISLMTSRPIHIFIQNGDPDSSFYAYYVDFLCVDKRERKKGIAPQMIQTHEYNQRRMNRNIHVSLFKRESELTGIVPLCIYDTCGFEIQDWILPFTLPPPYQLIEVGTTNAQNLHMFMQEKKKTFSLFATTDIGNWMELIKTGNLYCYLLIDREQTDIQAAFFFRKSCTFIRKKVEVISCISSICNKEITREIIKQAYLHSLFFLKKKHEEFLYAVIEDISDNGYFLSLLGVPNMKMPTAYFFYNFAYPTFSPKRVFILN